MATDIELVDALDTTWSSIAALAAGFSEADWRAPSPLPGWNVQDIVAHLVSVEAMLLGRPIPMHTASSYDHVRNDFGRMIEDMVDWYRSWTGAEILAEFIAVTSERIATLRALDEAGFGAPSWTPNGDAQVRDLLVFRLIDSWVHLHDLQHALDFEHAWDGLAAEVLVGRVAIGMGKAVVKGADAPEGTTVRWNVDAHSFGVVVCDGRGNVAEFDDATVTLTMTYAVFFGLATGRGDAAMLARAVEIGGDPELGTRVCVAMNVMR